MAAREQSSANVVTRGCLCNFLRNREKGVSVSGNLEGVVGWMKQGALPLLSANCFWKSQSYQMAVTKSGPNSTQYGLMP